MHCKDIRREREWWIFVTWARGGVVRTRDAPEPSEFTLRQSSCMDMKL